MSLDLLMLSRLLVFPQIDVPLGSFSAVLHSSMLHPENKSQWPNKLNLEAAELNNGCGWLSLRLEQPFAQAAGGVANFATVSLNLATFPAGCFSFVKGTFPQTFPGVIEDLSFQKPTWQAHDFPQQLLLSAAANTTSASKSIMGSHERRREETLRLCSHRTRLQRRSETQPLGPMSKFTPRDYFLMVNASVSGTSSRSDYSQRKWGSQRCKKRVIRLNSSSYSMWCVYCEISLWRVGVNASPSGTTSSVYKYFSILHTREAKEFHSCFIDAHASIKQEWNSHMK